MKKLICIATAILITAGIYAQGNASQQAGAPKKSEQKATKFYCPNGHYSSTSSGKCPKCKKSLVMDGMYYCPTDDGITSVGPIKCPKCGKQMKKMEGKDMDSKKM